MLDSWCGKLVKILLCGISLLVIWFLVIFRSLNFVWLVRIGMFLYIFVFLFWYVVVDSWVYNVLGLCLCFFMIWVILRMMRLKGFLFLVLFRIMLFILLDKIIFWSLFGDCGCFFIIIVIWRLWFFFIMIIGML